MRRNMNERVKEFGKKHRFRKRWANLICILSCVVVFCTAYALILPAITLEKTWCSIPEHTHTEDCYTQVTAATQAEPICTLESLDLHEHTEECFDENGEPACGYADFVIHEHDSSCYDEDGNLWCPLPEIEAHTHDEDCFSTPESEAVHTHTDECYTTEPGELICTESTEKAHSHSEECYQETETLTCDTPESDGHQHDDSCFDENGELTCTSEESDGHRHGPECYETTSELVCTLSEEPHQHTDECYAQNKVLICELSTEPAEDSAGGSAEAEPELICDKEEIILHEHGADCFDADGSLICGRTQVQEHVHSDACFETVEEAADTDTLTCGLTEGEGAHTHDDSCYDESGELVCKLEENSGHQHGPLCYGTWELTCGLKEHTHTEECNISVELTEEEQAQVDEVIALIDALPTQEEIEETLADFEDAEDEDGYDAYLAKIVTQVKEAYEAYSALTEAQQAKVTNADKLMALEPLWSAQTLEEFGELNNDSAYVVKITVKSISDGTAPWDNNDNAGNDSCANNKTVRTFDTVTYDFDVEMESYGYYSYSEAWVKMEFVLPLTEEQATFDQGAMAWIDHPAPHEPELTIETRNINYVDTQCQVLTCYKQLLPSAEHPSVVPGRFDENVTVNVKSMKNGDTFAPIFSAAMEYGTWSDESCPTEGHGVEKQTIVADQIKVSAAPKYNIKISGASSYKGTFDFSTGNGQAQYYGNGYFTENSQVVGRVTKIGVALELYNDNASKGFKGIELPDGSPITFDLSVGSQYQINTPASGTSYTQGQRVEVTGDYLPLLWSCDGNMSTGYGDTNADDRVLLDGSGFCDSHVPYNSGWSEDSTSHCYNGGKWTATQLDETIHVTVSDYAIDVSKMPTSNLDGYETIYGEALGIGVFSAGEIWVVQPFNKIGENGTSLGPDFDIVNQYGQGAFITSFFANSMEATTVSGQVFKDPDESNAAQTVVDDDRLTLGLELNLPGGIQNRVAYARSRNFMNYGVGVTDYRTGDDFAAIGNTLSIIGGFSYNARNETGNALYYATTLTKFYGSAIEVLEPEEPWSNIGWKDRKYFKTYYATKQDGSDWSGDYELQHTYEDELVFYNSLEEIPEGHMCVGVLNCFSDPDNYLIVDGYYFGFVQAKVREDMSLVGNTYMLASTTRGWTKDMFEQQGKYLQEGDNDALADWIEANTPDWTESVGSRGSLPAGNYNSANVEGSTWYTKTIYAEDGSGILTPHNSDWRHWGDTLLIIGYKTAITKKLCQESEPGTAKNVYNLDNEQRVVDFVLQPYTIFDNKEPGSTGATVTTTVTIVDILPKYLTYRAGSSYFGGTYTQTSDYGGTQGTVEGGELREPAVVPNADGTQTLTWIIPNVTVGAEMPAIYYSANIGDKSDREKDVPQGTTGLTNTVRISATHDIRQPSFDNGNYAEAGMSVTRGAAVSYGKYSVQDVVEADGSIDYVVYYDNNGSSEEKAPVLVDAMPVNDVGSSNFDGTWEITKFQISLVGASAGISLGDLNAELSWTFDPYYAGKTLADLRAEQGDPQGEWEVPERVEDGNAMPELGGKTPMMWVLNCISLPAGSELRVEYTIQLHPNEGSTLDHIMYANTFSTNTSTTTTETPAVRRTLEGLTWLDDSADGIQNEAADRRVSGVKVTLLKLKEGGKADNESDYEPYHYQGDPTKPVVQIETGQIISVRAENSDASTDYEPGCYKFTDLPAGTFAVRFEDGTTKISSLIVSPANQGGLTHDHEDSDGIATYSTDRSSLKQTVILGIDMPRAEDMSVVLYESKYHDSGFYEKGHELPDTGGSGTIPYAMGGLLLTGSGVILLYRKKKRGKEDFASS